MSEPLGTLLPAVAAHVPVADPAVLWLGAAAAGVLAMGLWDILGPEESEEAEAAPAGDADESEDFLASGEFGGSEEDDEEGGDDGLGHDDDVLAEIEPRISDLEREMEDLSSTVSTVKGEHRSIKESVESVEENVRKLLEVYEVVTQGANPFTDESGPASLGAGSANPFEVEDDPAGADDEPEDVESLFDDDTADDAVEDDAEEAEGMSFEELKSEFEMAAEEEPADEPDPELEAEPEEPDEAEEEPDAAPSPAPEDDPDKPYLAALPDGYGAELLVMEWLDFLVRETSPSDANRALRFYRTVDWVTDGVAEELETVLSGVTEGATRTAPDGGRQGELSIEHHARSLEYISQLRGLEEGTPHPAGAPDGSLEGIEFGGGGRGL